VPKEAGIEAQVETIRRHVQRDGETLVSCEELEVLCGGDSSTHQFDRVSNIAQQEGWMFEFQQDGSVRFKAGS